MSRNDPCWCGSQKKWKKCHYPEKAPQTKTEYFQEKYQIILKTEEQIAGIKTACQFAKSVLEKLILAAKEGVTTNELELLCRKLHDQGGAIPAPLHYGSPPYPKSACFSLNEVICHGIADERPLCSGDILNIDITSIVDEYYGDLSKMLCIGSVSEEKRLVVDCARACLHRAIRILKPGIFLFEIGDVIEEEAAKRGCSVVDQFVGHGIGLAFHEPPQVCHHKNRMNIPLEEGMIFTIEPMVNAGKREAVIDPVDQWTARTIDGKPSAQEEHTVLITETGSDVLTA
ncbi:MAG: methionyl aminopeptidase [Chlamydiota bacterium]